MPRENLNDLLAFLAVTCERSFTRVAAQLGVSQSARSWWRMFLCSQRLLHEPHKGRFACLSRWRACQPFPEPHEVKSRGRQDVLQVSFQETKVTGAAQAERPHGL